MSSAVNAELLPSQIRHPDEALDFKQPTMAQAMIERGIHAAQRTYRRNTGTSASTQRALERAARPDATEDDFYTAVKELRNAGMARQAHEMLDALGARYRRSNDLRFQLENARTLAAEGSYESSLTLLNDLKDKYPTNHHAFLLQAEILVEIRDYTTALNVMRTVPLAELRQPEREIAVFRGLQIAIYLAAANGRPTFAQPHVAPPCEVAVATMMIRDEQDVIEQNLCHHYRLGFRKYALILNRCRDNTQLIVEKFQAEHMDAIVCVITDPVEGYYQAGKT